MALQPTLLKLALATCKAGRHETGQAWKRPQSFPLLLPCHFHSLQHYWWAMHPRPVQVPVLLRYQLEPFSPAWTITPPILHLVRSCALFAPSLQGGACVHCRVEVCAQLADWLVQWRAFLGTCITRPEYMQPRMLETLPGTGRRHHHCAARMPPPPAPSAPWLTAHTFATAAQLRMMTQLCNCLEVEALPPYVPSDAERADPALYAANVRQLMVRLHAAYASMYAASLHDASVCWCKHIDCGFRPRRCVRPCMLVAEEPSATC